MKRDDKSLSATGKLDPYASIAATIAIAEPLQTLILSRSRHGITHILKNHGCQKVLDLCCGTGVLSAILAANGFHVVGVDSSPSMLERARKKRKTVQFMLADAAELPFKNEFDAAIICQALHEMDFEVREAVWSSMKRVVCNQGILIVMDFTVPDRNDLLSRICRSFIERDERGFLKIHPQHYHNFCQFMKNGGLRKWLIDHNETFLAERFHLGGNMGVIAVNAV